MEDHEMPPLSSNREICEVDHLLVQKTWVLLNHHIKIFWNIVDIEINLMNFDDYFLFSGPNLKTIRKPLINRHPTENVLKGVDWF